MCVHIKCYSKAGDGGWGCDLLMCNEIVPGRQQWDLTSVRAGRWWWKDQIQSYDTKTRLLPSSDPRGWSPFWTARPSQRVSCIFPTLCRFHFGVVCLLSAEESYSQQVSAASFEWLVNMSMCEQWSSLTSAVLMKQLQTEKSALEELGWWSTESQMRKMIPCAKGSWTY